MSNGKWTGKLSHHLKASSILPKDGYDVQAMRAEQLLEKAGQQPRQFPEETSAQQAL